MINETIRAGQQPVGATKMIMPKQILTSADLHEIRAAMTGLSGAKAKVEAIRLAEQRGCHWSRIYDATKDLRPRRKPRADRGKRRVDLKDHAGMALATSQVVAHNLNPELALELARANGHDTPIALGTYRRYLHENGLNRGQLRCARVVHRSFEAKAPGEIFQFDITGLKTRWLDTKTRRLLYVPESEVSRNHPNRKSTRVQVWAFVCIDDFSRYIFVRFVATSTINSCDVIRFELECFRHMGVPLCFYTDNDSKIVSQWNKRAESILDRAFADSGGFKLEQHMPDNPNATGKVERAHQIIEEFEKLLGCCPEPIETIEALNLFAERFCQRKNYTDHRATNMKPAIRFRQGHAVMRVPLDATLDAAFMARDIESVKVNADVTISIDGVRWQLPRSPQISLTLRGEKMIPNPFLDLAQLGRSLRVVWTREADWFLAIVGDSEYELTKIEATADVAGEHKALAESNALRNRNHFQTHAAELKKAARAAIKNGEQSPLVVPGVHVPFESATQAASSPIFPRASITPDLAAWVQAAPGSIPPSMVADRTINFFDAMRLFMDEGVFELTDAGQVSEFDKTWLKGFFGDRVEVGEADLRAAVESRGRERVLRSA